MLQNNRTGETQVSLNPSQVSCFSFGLPVRYFLEERRVREVIKPEKDDTFKQKTLEIFSKPHLLDFKQVNENDKHIMYAFIESMNERSKNLVNQAGYEYIRSFLTVAFSRFSPKPDSRVSKISTPEEKKKMESLLLEYYRGHSFFSTDYAFYGDKYYVLKEGGEIIAGVSAIPSSYKIYDMPGIWGWIIDESASQGSIF